MSLTPLEKRAERKERNKSMVDLNLVSLIDVFTILIFFLLSNSAEVETLPPTKAVKLPESTSQRAPRQTIVVAVNNTEILVEGRKVADTAAYANAADDLIPPLKAALDALGSRQIVRADSAERAKAVTIMGDQTIPYQLLRKVMVTCALASFTDVSFAVRSKG
jgi:biopolymer transport protein ExbD